MTKKNKNNGQAVIQSIRKGHLGPFLVFLILPFFPLILQVLLLLTNIYQGFSPWRHRVQMRMSPESTFITNKHCFSQSTFCIYSLLSLCISLILQMIKPWLGAYVNSRIRAHVCTVLSSDIVLKVIGNVVLYYPTVTRI